MRARCIHPVSHQSMGNPPPLLLLPARLEDGAALLLVNPSDEARLLLSTPDDNVEVLPPEVEEPPALDALVALLDGPLAEETLLEAVLVELRADELVPAAWELLVETTPASDCALVPSRQ